MAIQRLRIQTHLHVPYTHTFIPKVASKESKQSISIKHELEHQIDHVIFIHINCLFINTKHTHTVYGLNTKTE